MATVTRTVSHDVKFYAIVNRISGWVHPVRESAAVDVRLRETVAGS